jgi:hypothetical protein
MQKGVSIRVQLFIEGDAPPAQDFAQTGKEVALQLMQQALQHYQGPYAIQVQKLEPLEGGDDDDESASGDALDVKPLLSYTPAAQQSSSATTSPAASAAPTAPTTTAPNPTNPANPATEPNPPGSQAQGRSQDAAGQHPDQHPPTAKPSGEQPEQPPKHHFWER